MEYVIYLDVQGTKLAEREVIQTMLTTLQKDGDELTHFNPIVVDVKNETFRHTFIVRRGPTPGETLEERALVFYRTLMDENPDVIHWQEWNIVTPSPLKLTMPTRNEEWVPFWVQSVSDTAVSLRAAPYAPRSRFKSTDPFAKFSDSRLPSTTSRATFRKVLAEKLQNKKLPFFRLDLRQTALNDAQIIRDTLEELEKALPHRGSVYFAIAGKTFCHTFKAGPPSDEHPMRGPRQKILEGL